MYDDHSVAQLSSRLRIVLEGGPQPCVFDLREGESALVGQAVGCQLRIDDNTVAPHQCLLELRNGTLFLHNWSEAVGATVNGNAVGDEVILDLSDTVEFGDYRLRFNDEPHTDESPAPEPSIQEFDSQVELPPVEPETHQAPPSPKPVESVEDSTISLLHAEIAFLQKELEERDAIIASGPTIVAQPEPETPKVSEKRFKELMQELQASDARLVHMSNELRLLEETRAAEQEERHQITEWVNQIEKLSTKRNDEALAEIEFLRQRFEREKADRLTEQQRADNSLQAEGEVEKRLKDTLTVLRRDHESLREKYDESVARSHELEKDCDALRSANSEEAITERVNEAIRSERLAIAQERAQVSRREHEFNCKLRELELQLDDKSRVSEADTKFKAFRETLQELHQQEKAEYVAPSLGQQLITLWRRLDGPTDKE